MNYEKYRVELLQYSTIAAINQDYMIKWKKHQDSSNEAKLLFKIRGRN